MTEQIGHCPEVELVESLKPRVARFIREILFYFGPGLRDKHNFRIVDEFGFFLTGVPLLGPELQEGRWSGAPNIDIAVDPSCYKTPRPGVDHPVFIQLPPAIPALIKITYGLSIYKFIKASPNLLAIPTIAFNLDGITEVLVPEPVGHIEHFSRGTILNPQHTLAITGEDRFREWFKKLQMLRDIGEQIDRPDIFNKASEMVRLSLERWQEQGWTWLIE